MRDTCHIMYSGSYRTLTLRYINRLQSFQDLLQTDTDLPQENRRMPHGHLLHRSPRLSRLLHLAGGHFLPRLLTVHAMFLAFV
jgi:hypothetical protein